MRRRTKVMIAGTAVAAAVLGGAGSRWPAAPMTTTRETADHGAPPSTRLRAAALEHTGGAASPSTEVGDEESYYEVEVTLDDGSQVDVQLDEQFNVVGDEADDDGSGEDD